MKYILFLISVGVASCAPPDIPNLSRQSLEEIPYKHRRLVQKIHLDFQEICETLLGKNFYKLGGDVFEKDFIINDGSLQTIKVARRQTATVLYQNFSCGGTNPWQTTSSIKFFIMVDRQIFEGWASGALFVVEDATGSDLIIPQHPVFCGYYRRVDDYCFSAVVWHSSQGMFKPKQGVFPLSEYKSLE